MQVRHLFRLFDCHRERVLDEYVFEHLYRFALTLLPDEIRELFETDKIHSVQTDAKFTCRFKGHLAIINLPGKGSLHYLVDAPNERYFTRMAMAAVVLKELLQYLNKAEFAEFLNHYSGVKHACRHSGLTTASPPVHIIMYIERMQNSAMSKPAIINLLKSEQLYNDYQASFLEDANLSAAAVILPSKKL